jgi:hypothetical protein
MRSMWLLLNLPKKGHTTSFTRDTIALFCWGLVDANLAFIMADVGCNGRVSGAGVLQETAFYRKLKNGALALPKHDDTVGNMNFVFVADEAFALTENILKPFPP